MTSARCVAVPAGRRAFAASAAIRAGHKKEVAPTDFKVSTSLAEASGPNALFGPGSKDHEIPTSFEQATGVERLELLAQMEGIDLFDDRPLVQDRKGTPEDPVVVDSFHPVRYIGCTGFPADSQEVSWLKLEAGKVTRDWESGCCYTLNYIGPDDAAAHH